MRGRTFSRKFKLDVARQVVTGAKRHPEGTRQACREHELSESLLLRWQREYEERGEEAFTAKAPCRDEALEARIAELERYCGQLSLENSVLGAAARRAQSRSGTP